MKTKTLLIVAAITLAAGIAAPARAGVSVNISFGAPVVFRPPVVVAPSPYSPPVVACAPVVVRPAPVYYAPAPYRRVVYVAPRYDRHHDGRDRDWDRDDRDRDHDRDHGPRGGHR